MNIKNVRPTATERFLEKICVTPSCWLWMGAKRNGYGMFWRNRTLISAHRFSYELYIGPITEGMLVCHRCDNPSCVNPEHFFLGTNSQNMLDMRRKGRHPAIKLTEKEAGNIKKLYIRGRSQFNIAGLALMFGVSKTQIHRIVTNKKWITI